MGQCSATCSGRKSRCVSAVSYEPELHYNGDIPLEIVLHIMDWLSVKDTMKIRLLSCYICNIVQKRDQFWKEIVFGMSQPKTLAFKNPTLSIKDLFQKAFMGKSDFLSTHFIERNLVQNPVACKQFTGWTTTPGWTIEKTLHRSKIHFQMFCAPQEGWSHMTQVIDLYMKGIPVKYLQTRPKITISECYIGMYELQVELLDSNMTIVEKKKESRYGSSMMCLNHIMSFEKYKKTVRYVRVTHYGTVSPMLI
jgi:hypothetical protein